MGISAVIITKNEARNIERCLLSLRDIADEVIVVDSSSTDGTQAIARNLGARVVEMEWQGYAATKNAAIVLATLDYILSLDADEALSDTLRSHITRHTNQLQGTYSFNRLAYYCGQPIRHAGWYPDRKIRLFPQDKARWEGAFVHEELVADSDLSNKQLEGDLLHYTYYTIAEHVARANKYSDLAAEQIAASSKSNLLLRARWSSRWRFFKMYVLKQDAKAHLMRQEQKN